MNFCIYFIEVPAAASHFAGVMHIDSLDHLLLVHAIWFTLTFEHYITLRLVSRRWRRLYIDARETAMRRYLRVRFEGTAGADTTRFYVDADGFERRHGEFSFNGGDNRYIISYRFGRMHGWERTICGQCGGIFFLRYNSPSLGSPEQAETYFCMSANWRCCGLRLDYGRVAIGRCTPLFISAIDKLEAMAARVGLCGVYERTKYLTEKSSVDGTREGDTCFIRMFESLADVVIKA